MSDTSQLVRGTVVKVNSFGAILTLETGAEGFLHISELRDEFIRNMSDWVHEGLELTLLPLGMDKQGKRQNLSVKQADVILREAGLPVNVLDYNQDGRNRKNAVSGKAKKAENRNCQHMVSPEQTGYNIGKYVGKQYFFKKPRRKQNETELLFKDHSGTSRCGFVRFLSSEDHASRGLR